ncbi:MAG: HPr family phosphocarrier protein [Proteobacteria bacterium]|nr:HPr family phosphocarrier protein [Pseudomonadota bacterium]MBU2567572.1 HPr family phosphocarrier protein [Elusimicrobiota bacterium]
MQERTFKIKNRLGLHARPAAMLVQITTRHASKVMIHKDDQEVDGKSIMGLMTLAAECGSEIKIVADGVDEQQVLDEIAGLIDNKFSED